MIFLDTNILLYSISGAAEEQNKRRQALELLEQRDCCLSVQVLQEFYVQATRATRQNAVPYDVAAGLIRAWLRFRVQDMTADVMMQALDIHQRHGLSYWDSAIVAAALKLGCATLYSEDMQDGWRLDGLTILNPF